MALGLKNLKKDDGFQAGSCIQVDESGKALAPPFHIASLLALPPSPAPEGAGSSSAHINYGLSPSVAGRSSADCNGAADWNVGSLSTGEFKSYSFQQQPPVTPTSLPPPFSSPPPPPPTPPFSPPLCYPPSVVHVCYLPSELGSHHFSSSCYNGNPSSYPPLPPSSSPSLLLPSPHTHSPPLLLPSPHTHSSSLLLPSPHTHSSSLLLPSPHAHSRVRTTYTPKQLETLEDFFAEKKYVSYEDRLKLSSEIGVSEKQVKMWFQNRRTKMKKESNGHCYRNRGRVHVAQKV